MRSGCGKAAESYGEAVNPFSFFVRQWLLPASPRIRMGWGAVILLTFALFTLGAFGAFISAFGCENVQSATTRADVCELVGGEGDPRWWLFVSAPAFLFGAVALGSGRRGRLDQVWLAVCAALIVVDAILIAIVTDNL